MATITLGVSSLGGFDMRTCPMPPVGRQLFAATSTSYVVSTGPILYSFSGFGFTYDALSRLAGGTVTSHTQVNSGSQTFAGSGFAANAASSLPLILSGQSPLVLQSMLFGNDTIFGSSGLDVMFGGSGDDV